ncbi:MAG: class I SAM-dependent methyltransferase [Clostridiaceae bacterium]
MDISMRLKTMANMVDKCCCCADIGTDHGYIPIYLIKKGLCDKAIASDINKGPCDKAKRNIKREELEDKIECRIGGGFTTIEVGEANVAIIAGMGGNLIRDIIEEKIEVFKNLDYAIVQPVQNPEVLREYIYSKGYTIIEEELCFEEGIYYEIIKIQYDNKIKKVDSIFYEVSQYLIENNHPLIKDFILYKINKYNKVLSYIKEDTEGAKIKKDEISNKICKLKELIACL